MPHNWVEVYEKKEEILGHPKNESWTLDLGRVYIHS